MAFPAKKSKGKGFDLECIAQNFEITVVTCCGFIFQGTIEDDDNTRTQYGYPVVFPAMTMDCAHGKEDDKDCGKKEDKKEHCPKPIEVDVDVKCDNDPKYICLQLTCVPTFVCCTAGVAAIVPVGTVTTPLFAATNTVLINVEDIVAIGPSTGCFFTPA